MRANLLLLLSSLIFNAANADVLPKVSTGTIERITAVKSDLIPSRFIDVWLPPGYSEDKQYRTLYMHDGRMLFDADVTWNGQEWRVDEVAGDLIIKGDVEPFIVVAIPNGGPLRHSEYFPQTPFSALPEEIKTQLYQANRGPDTPLFAREVYSDDYLRFIVTTLIPYIEARYPVGKGKQDRFIMGSSMGGLISMYAILEYPDMFAGAACLSTHWPGAFYSEENPIPDAFISYMNKALPKPGAHKLYFDYGTETLDAMYPPLQQKVDSLMERKGFTSDQWQTKKFEGAAHTENDWAKRLHIPLTFLMTAQ